MAAKRFRKKPVVIEAWDWSGTSEEAHAICKWIAKASRREDLARFGPLGLQVRTIETAVGEWLTASPGDFIIRGVQGEFYPCKPDIFAATYESVE
jgi:hypothetical protein